MVAPLCAFSAPFAVKDPNDVGTRCCQVPSDVGTPCGQLPVKAQVTRRQCFPVRAQNPPDQRIAFHVEHCPWIELSNANFASSSGHQVQVLVFVVSRGIDRVISEANALGSITVAELHAIELTESPVTYNALAVRDMGCFVPG